VRKWRLSPKRERETEEKERKKKRTSPTKKGRRRRRRGQKGFEKRPLGTVFFK